MKIKEITITGTTKRAEIGLIFDGDHINIQFRQGLSATVTKIQKSTTRTGLLRTVVDMLRHLDGVDGTIEDVHKYHELLTLLLLEI